MSYDNTGCKLYRVLKVVPILPKHYTYLYEIHFVLYPNPNTIYRTTFNAEDELDAFKLFSEKVDLLPPHVPFPGIDS